MVGTIRADEYFLCISTRSWRGQVPVFYVVGAAWWVIQRTQPDRDPGVPALESGPDPVDREWNRWGGPLERLLGGSAFFGWFHVGTARR